MFCSTVDMCAASTQATPTSSVAAGEDRRTNITEQGDGAVIRARTVPYGAPRGGPRVLLQVLPQRAPGFRPTGGSWPAQHPRAWKGRVLRQGARQPRGEADGFSVAVTSVRPASFWERDRVRTEQLDFKTSCK